MSKVVKKKIKIPVGIKDQNLAEMFNQMLGTGSVNMSIAYPRYIRIKGIVDQILKLFEMFNGSPFMDKYKEFQAQRDEIAGFLSQSREQFKEMFSMDFSDYEWDLNLVEEEQKKLFSEAYEKIKKSDLINSFVIMCDRLVVYKRYIADAQNLNPIFITSMAGVEFCPFPFTHLNLKYIFSLGTVQENTKRFFMIVMNKAFELSYKLWGEITSPDINVDDFVEVIMSNIKEIQKRPELNRCGKAFKKIEESVHLLKGRFNNYYRDFIQTKNSTIMMEHFILDVSNSTKADVETTRQFRQIIGFYKKIAQDQITNPKVKMLFDKVNESFKELERNTGNLVNIQNDGEEQEDSDDDSDDSSDDEDNIAAKEAERVAVEEESRLRQAQEALKDKSIDELVDFINSDKKKPYPARGSKK